MGSNNSPQDDRSKPATAAQRALRRSALRGSEQNAAPDHVEYETTRDPDTELHLDGEEDVLYSDGVDIEENTDTLAGTRGTSSGIKP